MTDPTQKQRAYSAHREITSVRETAAHILPSLTRAELAQLIARRPEVWAKFEKWLKVLP